METATTERTPMTTTTMQRTAMEKSPRPEHAEGAVARSIEEQTAKLPSDTFLWAALGSVAVSFTLQLLGKPQPSLFIGQWAPSFLLFGIYNKLVKVAGSDAVHP
jgi:hypothetical protein